MSSVVYQLELLDKGSISNVDVLNFSVFSGSAIAENPNLTDPGNNFQGYAMNTTTKIIEIDNEGATSFPKYPLWLTISGSNTAVVGIVVEKTGSTYGDFRIFEVPIASWTSSPNGFNLTPYFASKSSILAHSVNSQPFPSPTNNYIAPIYTGSPALPPNNAKVQILVNGTWTPPYQGPTVDTSQIAKIDHFLVDAFKVINEQKTFKSASWFLRKKVINNSTSRRQNRITIL
jgi:hypothetical protein